MNDSILNSIKQGCGLRPEYDAFDNDLIIHINSVFMFLNQLGVGPKQCFSITGEEETWDQFFSGGVDLAAVKSYMIMKVRLIFDAPTNGTLMQALKENIAEFEWRLNVHVDPEDTFSEE